MTGTKRPQEPPPPPYPYEYPSPVSDHPMWWLTPLLAVLVPVAGMTVLGLIVALVCQ